MIKMLFLHIPLGVFLAAVSSLALSQQAGQAEPSPNHQESRQSHAAQALPQSYQEFKTRYQREAKTPEGAVKMYFVAVFSYINESTRAEGAKMLRYAMHLDRPLKNSINYVTFMERLEDDEENHIFRSFAVGTSPENDYRMSPEDFELMIVSRKKEIDYTRMMLHSSGADSPRPVWVKEYDGLWYTINNASTYLRVRPPRAAIEKRKNAHDADYDNVLSK